MRKATWVVIMAASFGAMVFGAGSFWMGLEQNCQNGSSLSLGGFVSMGPTSLRVDAWIGQDACTLGLSMGLCSFAQNPVVARAGWAASLEGAETYFLAGPFSWVDFLFGKYGWIELEGNLWLANLADDCCVSLCFWGLDAKALGWLSPCPELLRIDFFAMRKIRPDFLYQECRVELNLSLDALCNPCLPDLPLWAVFGYKQAEFSSSKWHQAWTGPICGLMIWQGDWEAGLLCHHLLSISSPNKRHYEPRLVLRASVNF